MAKIKVLKDTPSHSAGEVLTLREFDDWYTMLTYGDGNIIKNIKENYSKWFAVVEESRFKVDDWVWSNLLNRALQVVDKVTGKMFYPNSVSIAATKAYTETYTRLATFEEIADAKLYSFQDGEVLIGRTTCFYYSSNKVWVPLANIGDVVNEYFSTQYPDVIFNTGSPHVYSRKIRRNGIQIGCMTFSAEEMERIDQIING